MSQLPINLAHSIQQLLAQESSQTLAKAAKELSSLYRGPRKGTINLNKEHCLAYLAIRMPATFAVATSVCARLPYPVTSFMDCGTGPGTLAWALAHLNHPLQRITLYEKQQEFIHLGKQLFRHNTALPENIFCWQQSDLTASKLKSPHDLVSISYVLNELSVSGQKHLIRQAWESSQKSIVIIEPGTPAGFQNLLQARMQLIELGAHIYAPCPHNLSCPMQDTEDWCHFSTRLPRTPWHQRIKQTQLAFEDEKYCYLIACRALGHETQNRIIKRPIKGSGHISLDLCTPTGLNRKIVSKRTKAAYIQARKSAWGDVWSNNLSES